MKSTLDLFDGTKRVFLRTMIAFKRLNKWVVRVPTNRVNPNREKHPEVERTNNDFKKKRKLVAAIIRALIGYPIWKAAAALYTTGGKTSDNFLFHINHDKFAGKVVGCFHLFMFSMGPRLLPWNFDVKGEGNTVTITWSDNRRCPHHSPHDILLAGILYDKQPGRPILIDLTETTGATRLSGSASFEINPKYGKHLHVYPFFCDPTRQEYSNSQYFNVIVT